MARTGETGAQWSYPPLVASGSAPHILDRNYVPEMKAEREAERVPVKKDQSVARKEEAPRGEEEIAHNKPNMKVVKNMKGVEDTEDTKDTEDEKGVKDTKSLSHCTR